jgi:hypothetical protein
MDKSFAQQGSQTQHRRGFLAGFEILDRFENWLARLVQVTQLLTEEEQRDAGIHLRQWTEEEQMAAGIHLGDERDT